MKKRITVQSAKAKGRNLQKWVAGKIAELTGFECGKDCPIESRPMGQSGTDVRLDKAVKELFPFAVECKCQESWSVHSWIEQARQNETAAERWLLICKRSRQKPVVVIDADLFFDILGGNYGNKGREKAQGETGVKRTKKACSDE